jgi:hypothetical protein
MGWTLAVRREGMDEGIDMWSSLRNEVKRGYGQVTGIGDLTLLYLSHQGVGSYFERG